jgi:ketosteroid isomerase-like protein
VQQRVLRLTRADSTIIDWPGCIVFDVADGRITRLDEYVDISQLNVGS